MSGGLDEKAALALLDQPSEHVRAWGVRLLCDAGAAVAGHGGAIRASWPRPTPSPKVRLSLASALQRLPLNERWAVAEPLASHKEDASDPMLPLDDLVWSRTARAGRSTTGRRAGIGLPDSDRAPIRGPPHGGGRPRRPAWPPLSHCSSRRTTRPVVDLLIGTHDALRGRKHIARPDGWPDAFAGLLARPDLTVVEQALLLALDLDDPKAAPVLRGIVRDRETPLDMRHRALSALVERRVPGLVPDLHGLVDDSTLRGPVLRALAAYDDPTTPEIILSHYAYVYRVRARRCDRHAGRPPGVGAGAFGGRSSAAAFRAAI